MDRRDDAVGSKPLAARSVQSDPVVAAIQRVLEAERVAEKQLLFCRQQAQARIAAARDTAAAIARRTSDRAAKLHTAYLQKIAHAVAGLTHPAAPDGVGAASTGEGAAGSQAAARLAEKLTGGADETER